MGGMHEYHTWERLMKLLSVPICSIIVYQCSVHLDSTFRQLCDGEDPTVKGKKNKTEAYARKKPSIISGSLMISNKTDVITD